MQPVELAVIADVHGNAWAREAVLRDIAQRGVTAIVNLGDHAYDWAAAANAARAAGWNAWARERGDARAVRNRLKRTDGTQVSTRGRWRTIRTG